MKKITLLISFILVSCNQLTTKKTLNERCMLLPDAHYCDSKINYDLLEKLEESNVMWQTYKKNHSNSYKYSTSFNSWTGNRSKTTFLVKKGIIVKRSYISFEPNKISGNKELESSKWSEIISVNLGENKYGAPLKTIDELYLDCYKILSTKKKSENHVYLKFDNYTILNICTFFPKNCADDCYEGPIIEELSFQ